MTVANTSPHPEELFAHEGEPPPALRSRPAYGRWIVAVVLVLLMARVAYSLYQNQNLDVETVREYLFDPLILDGVQTTITLTALCFTFGIVGGLLVALMRLSGNPVLSTVSVMYVWFFRSVPPLVQLIFWAFFAALYPRLDLKVPFTDIVVISRDTNALLTPFAAAVVAITLISFAYAAEVIRGGIAGVDQGQVLAARSLGMSRLLTLRRIILPQAMPSMVPPMGNLLIDILKSTSLVSVIGGAELMTQVQRVYSQSFNVIPLLCVAAIWYLAITSVISIIQALIERHFAKSKLRTSVRRSRPAPAGEMTL